MKVVILCGGLGTRLHEETEFRPKPLVPIGPRPIVWHIMKSYAAFGFSDFVLALGYKGEMIKDFFLNYEVLYSDFALELGSKRVTPLRPAHDEADWKITFVDTGQDTQTGGRVKRLQAHLTGEPRFMLTYGDGVSDVDIARLLEFHTQSKRAAVVTGVHPLARWGELIVEGDAVARFSEKPPNVDSWINGGYFVMTPRVFDYIDGDRTPLEQQPMERLAADGELGIYKHDGYWQAMDTYRELQMLNQQWSTGRAPWTRWWRDEGNATPRLKRSA